MSRSRAKPYHHGDLKHALLETAQKLLETGGLDSINFRKLARATGVSHAAPLSHFPDRLSLDAAIAAQGFERLTVRLKGAAAARPTERSTGFLEPLLEEDRARPQPSAPEWRTTAFRAAAPPPAQAAFFRSSVPSSPISTPPPGAAVPDIPTPEFAMKLTAAGLAYLRFALEHPGLFRAMYSPGLAEQLARTPKPEKGSALLELQESKAEALGVFADLVKQGQKAGEFRKELPPDHAARLFTALAEGLAFQYLEQRSGFTPTRIKEAEPLLELLLGALHAERSGQPGRLGSASR